MTRINFLSNLFFRYAAMITLLLTLACGNVWAGYESLNEGNMHYTFNNSDDRYYNYNKTDNGHTAVALGTLTGSFTITSASFQFSDDWADHPSNTPFLYLIYTYDNWSTKSDWQAYSYDYNWSTYWVYKNPWGYTIATNESPSGNFSLKYYWEAKWNDDTKKTINNNGSNYEFTYTILPPAVSDFTVSQTGALSGSGTADDPYIVPSGGTLQLDLSSASQAHSDANSSAQYSIDNSSWGTATSNTRKTLSNITSTSLQNWVVYAKYYNSTASLSGETKSKTIYYTAINIHEPGIYVSSGVGGYNKALTSYNNALYEWYGVYKTSSTNKILASQTSPGSNPTGANVVATFTSGTYSNAGWMLAKIKDNTSSSTSSAKDEFPVCSHAVQVDNATYFTFAVKGYSQVGILATDKNADRSKNKYLKVFIDGVDVTTSASASTSASARHYSIDSAQSHVVTLYTTSTDKSSIWGISLKPARPRISATSMAGYTYTQGDVANTMTVTASPVVAGHTLTYTWYSNTSATMSGATQVQSSTSSNYTPSTANVGGLYYVCVVSEEGCNTSTTPWSGLITVNAAACGATAPGAICKGSLSGCSVTLTASGSPASNNTWYWQSSASGTSTSESGASKSVDEAGTYYLRSYYSTGSCWSDAVSYEVTNAHLTPAAPTGFSAGSITSSGATFSITDAGSASSYDIYYSTESTAPTSGTSVTTTSDSKSKAVTGLTASTTYYAWVRAVCGSNKSSWVALNPGGDSHTFTTSSSTYTGLSVTKDPSAGSASAPTISATSVTQGSGVTVTAGAAASGYVFTGWTSENGTFASASSLETTFTPTANNAVATANYAAVKTIVIKILNEENKGGWVCQSYTTVPADHAPVITTDGDWVVVTVTGVVSITSPKFAYEAGGMWYYLDGETITESACYDWDGSSRSCDATAPTLVSSDPANGDTGEATSGTIVLTFSEEIDNVDDSKFSLTGATIGTVEIDGSDATKVNIAYSSASYSSTVTLASAAGAVSDAAGNASAALSDISFTTKAEPTLTALVSGTRYEVAVMVPEGTTITGSDQYAEGLSANTKFFLVGSASSSTTMKVKNDSKTLDDINFANSYYFGGAASLTDNTPTTKAIKFKLSGAGTVTAWLRRSAKVKFAKEGEAGTVFGSGDDKDYNKYSLDVASGGTYYIYATDGSTTLYAIKFDEDVCSAPTSAVINGGGTKLQHEAIELEASASGTESGVTTYTWYRGNDGEDAAKEAGAIQATSTSGSTYTIAECSTTDAAVYYCVISNGTGCDVTASASISVTAAYTLTYSANTDDPSVGNMPSQEIHTPGIYTLSSKVPTRNGYTFDGWYYYSNYAGTRWDVGASFTTGALNETLYAKWAEITHTVTISGGAHGTASPSSVTGVGIATASGNITATPSSGYSFSSWDLPSGVTAASTYSASSNPIHINATADGKTITATYTATEYSITYNLNGGSLDGSQKTSYTVEDDDYELPVPVKADNVFVGWYDNSTFTGSSIEILEAGSTSNKTYWAKWGETVTVSWTVTKVDDELYRGGGGYSVKAVINENDWNAGFMDELELTATEGVTLKNIEVSENGESKVQVTADFDITTDLAADATSITFTLNVPADGTYGPKVDEHEEDLTSCAGSSTVWNFAYASDDRPTLTNSNASTEGNKNTLSATTGSGNLYYFAGSSDAFETDKYLKMNGASSSGSVNSRSVYQNRCFYIDITSNGTLTIQQYADNGNGAPKYVVANTRPLQSDYPSSSVAPTTTGGATYEINVTNYSSGTADRIWVAYPTAKAYIISVTWTPIGGGGTVTPTLTWDDGGADIANDGVSKSTSNDDFVYTARQDKNSLGAITYSSSDATVATVNATTGQVHLVGAAGTATITATIAASGCFSSANVSYTITVTDDCDDEAGTIETEDLGCAAGIKMTVTGHTTTASTSYQWYKVGSPDVEVGTDLDNYTATTAGSYYVIVTNTGERHCAKRSTNTITVEAQAAATVTKIVDSWYVKKDRRTPDIELVKTTNATSFTVTSGSITIWESAGSIKTGFAGCGFHMGENGIIYLNGTEDNGDAPAHDDGTWAAGDETLTITAIGCGGNASQNITIHKQAATNYKEIAFVADGGKGMRKDSITVGHGDGTELYEYLDSVGTAAGKRLFQLSERNIYWTTDEKAIREEYSQFDAILITDDPSTNTVVKKGDDYKTKGYVNAFGTMVDVRPIFTMEAYVSALKNWGSKGIAGNPQSPNPRQYEMRLECKDHEIYGAGLPDPDDGTNVWEEVIGGETFRHVILVDSTKGIYNGVAYNAQTAGNEKPALQGFTGEAAGSLLGLGRILEGTLQAAIERQKEPAARLLVMGINAKALQPTCALTNEGKTVIKNILVYLLKTNMEEVDDCSNYFTGKTDSDWNKTTNWSKSSLPNYETRVRILAPCEVSGVTAHVAQVDIVSSGESSIRANATGLANCNGKLTINANGALIVEGKVRAADAPHFAANDLKPTTVNDLVLNTSSANQAALIFNNDEGKTQATVNLYSLGRKVSETNQFQYFAIPMSYLSVNPTFANETHGITIYTYVWLEATGWDRRGYYTDLYAFEGIGITTDKTTAHEYTMKGTLASTKDQEIPITADGKKLNLIGNSWTAPIQISELEASDFGDASSAVEQTVYIYCAGHGKKTADGKTEAAGQWLAIPFEAARFAAWDGLKVIPSMQAFQIKTAGEGTLTLDYDKHVRGGSRDLTAKLRAPQRRAAHDGVDLMRIRVADSKTHTDLYLFEGDQFSDAFDNGWEANYRVGTNESAKLYARVATGVMSVAAMSDLEGTPIYFIPGQETEYTFTFGGNGMGYYLNDLKLQQSTLISEGAEYSFTYEKGDAAARFMISATPYESPQVTTGTENVQTENKPRKILYNNKLYIIYNGHVYSATGEVVR